MALLKHKKSVNFYSAIASKNLYSLYCWWYLYLPICPPYN